ncbi:MAG: SET domain-containing protein-lysine N-methyltransferase [Nanoarchaeota archaeon]|nr:SET domain-containing protein-lysine N-methyltransferase [Nanoarchaeota archaeon]
MISKLIIKRGRLGKSVFAKSNFKKDEKIIEFKGKIIKTSDIPEINSPQDDRYVQIGRYKYVGPSNSFDDFINHSCNPNSGLKITNKSIILIAIKNIKTGEEITWDYSTTMNEDDWEMDCKCKNKSCRKRIKDFKYLPKKIQNKYIKLGIVPKYAIPKTKE